MTFARWDFIASGANPIPRTTGIAVKLFYLKMRGEWIGNSMNPESGNLPAQDGGYPIQPRRIAPNVPAPITTHNTKP